MLIKTINTKRLFFDELFMVMTMRTLYYYTYTPYFLYIYTLLFIHIHTYHQIRKKACSLYSQQACSTATKNFIELLSGSSAFDTCKHGSNRAIFDVGYQAWNEELSQKLRFWCSSQADTKKIRKLFANEKNK